MTSLDHIADIKKERETLDTASCCLCIPIECGIKMLSVIYILIALSSFVHYIMTFTLGPYFCIATKVFAILALILAVGTVLLHGRYICGKADNFGLASLKVGYFVLLGH